MNKKDFLHYIYDCVRLVTRKPEYILVKLSRTCRAFKRPPLEILHTILYNVTDFAAYVRWTRRNGTFLLNEVTKRYHSAHIYEERGHTFRACWNHDGYVNIAYDEDDTICYRIIDRFVTSRFNDVICIEDFFKPYMNSFK